MDDAADKKPDDWATEKRIVTARLKNLTIGMSKKIDNPEYEDDKTVYKYDSFGFIGFDLWQVKGGTIFDNIIVCDDKAEADAFAAKWKTLSEHEKAEKKKAEESKKAEETKKEDEADDDDDDAEDKKESEDM